MFPNCLDESSPSSTVVACATTDRLYAWLASLGLAAHHEIQVCEWAREASTDQKTKRRLEFEAGRASTARQLARLGEFGSVTVNPDRSPHWPIGFVGSLSHSQLWLWTAVARESSVCSLGVDTEPVVDWKTSQEIRNEIATPAEWKIAAETGLDSLTTFSLVFSAKEAFYKCWYPVTGEYFDFAQAAVESTGSGRLRIRNTKNNPNHGHRPDSLDVYFKIEGDSVFTVTWMEHGK